MSFSMLCAVAKQRASWNLCKVSKSYVIMKNTRTPMRSAQRYTSNHSTTSARNARKALPEVKGPSKDSILIYKFPHITTVSQICRAKRLGLLLSAIATPSAIALAYAGITSTDLIIGVCGISILVILKVCLLNYLCKNMVGLIYSSPDQSSVHILYTDEEGRRKDETVPVSDLIPLSDLPRTPTEPLFISLRRFSQPKSKVYKLNLSHGEITNKDIFCTIFGKVD